MVGAVAEQGFFAGVQRQVALAVLFHQRDDHVIHELGQNVQHHQRIEALTQFGHLLVELDQLPGAGAALALELRVALGRLERDIFKDANKHRLGKWDRVLGVGLGQGQR